MSEERIITEQEEQAIRLVHHDFEGHDIDTAACIMGTTVKEVKTLLKSVERKAPQMFPILTPRQQVILRLYNQHQSRIIVEQALGITTAVLAKEVKFLRRRGFLANQTPIRYEPSAHDALVKERF